MIKKNTHKPRDGRIDRGANDRSGNPYEDLANAIVLQAVKDYRIAAKGLIKDPQNSRHLHTKKEIEEFLRSDWFTVLTGCDGEVLLAKLEEEQVQKSYRYEIETTKDTIKHYEELLKKDMEKELAEKRDRLAELEKLIK